MSRYRAQAHCWHLTEANYPYEEDNLCCMCGAVSQTRREEQDYDPNAGHGPHVSHTCKQHGVTVEYGVQKRSECFGDDAPPLELRPLVAPLERHLMQSGGSPPPPPPPLDPGQR